ncbi:serine/threonine protein kinase [Halorhodospira halochloris]|uniref:Stress response kinase A n=1 Tax=Halorhodospira halochloris TaxID=1052 RepID=A0A0X8XAC2_HALHR|nr:serine/threonine protein kinase [Halorhodospira halochloris]MCG5530600.1 serine/threonine protein kinase [Halorhodospira halochloris]MCG5547818.1 serine/threonine protein kinase [Halorhodospira halochloris]BAU58410.1 YihE protein [Halorhodospira halochloris]
MDRAHPFESLDPASVLDAVEKSSGHYSDGRLLALNSYENRVYMVGLEQGGAVVAKFYRPARWSDEQIQEEHDFAAELHAADVPIISPMEIDGQTLFHCSGFRLALYPMRGGRMLEVDDLQVLRQLGTYIARIHVVGQCQARFSYRPHLDILKGAAQARDSVLSGEWLPAHLHDAYTSLSRDLLQALEQCVQRAGEVQSIRLHGDFHPGNVLQTPDGFHLVDLDDARSGPAIQDLWMLLPGEHDERQLYLDKVLEGYRLFADFDPRQLHLVEPLRTLRIMRHAAWLAERWDDPAFPRAFPWFAESRYWEEHLLSLREQLAALQEPALEARY